MQQGIFEKSITVTPDYCDAAAQLSPLAAFTIFQGIAAQHAELIGVGGAAMAKRGEFWLTVHTRVDFLHRAGLMDELTAATWPEPCDGKAVRCYRSYSLRRGDALLALGRTQWAVLGPEKKLMPFAQTGFPADFPFSDRTGITDHPTRFADDLTQAELVRGYTVRPTDIDFGRHMNNVAYVRVLLDCFSAAELASGRIASMEVHYAAPCLEGEELGVYCRREESGCRLAIKKADGKAAPQQEKKGRGHGSRSAQKPAQQQNKTAQSKTAQSKTTNHRGRSADGTRARNGYHSRRPNNNRKG